jgi:N-acylneuraminate cytidylyltransferase
MNTAIITARGGSKRIFRKNTREFEGKPIIAYPIEAALASGLFDEVMVSTEDEGIAETARKFGACVPFMRSAQNADDFSGTVDVLLEVFAAYRKIGREIDIFCCLYPTAVFVTGEMLKRAMSLFLSEDADSVVSVVPFPYPPQRSFALENGYLKKRWTEAHVARSQDLERRYVDCGNFYIGRTAVTEKEKSLFLPRTMPFVIPEMETQDINDENDWTMARLKYRFKFKKGGAGFGNGLEAKGCF